MPIWTDALKKWNTGKSLWCVPRKGTKEYAEVMRLMSAPAAAAPKKVPSKAVHLYFDEHGEQAKPPRKPRSDKGKVRGPRAKKGVHTTF